MIQNFSWLLPGRLAGFGVLHTLGLDDLAFLREEGIGALVSLTESPASPAFVSACSMRYQHLPVEDMAPPSLGQVERFVGFVDEAGADDVAVAVHCRAGLGRTGTMLAAYLIHQGMSWGEALERVRGQRPGSVETPSQEHVLREFARGRQIPAPKS